MIFGRIITGMSKKKGGGNSQAIWQNKMSGRLVVWGDGFKKIKKKKLFRGYEEVEGIYKDKGDIQ